MRAMPLALLLLPFLGAFLSGCEAVTKALDSFQESPAPPPLVLRLSHYLGPDDDLSFIVQGFARAVNQRTEGRVRVLVYPNSQLVRLNDAFDAVSSGEIEAAIMPEAYAQPALPAVGINSLPFLFSDWNGFQRVMQDPQFRQVLASEYLKRNLVALEWNVLGWRWLASNKRPVVRPDDLRGLKVRAEEWTEQTLVELAGGHPIRLPADDVYLSAQAGIVDAAFTSTDGFTRGNLHQVFGYYPKAQSWLSTVVVLVNKTFWDSLPQDIQIAIREAAHQFLWQEWFKRVFDIESGEWISIGAGREVYEFNDDDRRAWEEVVKALEADYVREAGPVGQTLLDIAKEAAEEAGAAR